MSVKDQSLEFVRYVLGQICENREAIEATSVDDERGTLITISVDPADMGRLIGKGGQTVDALRLLVRTMGARENLKINLKVSDPV